jgi:hypothetical protein
MGDAVFEPPEVDLDADVPVELDELPDGEPSLMLGDVRGYAAFNHRQGDNPEHIQLDCGLISVQDVLQQFGARVTEADIFNCGVLWQVPEDVGNGAVNHAVTVTGVAREPQSRKIQGFYINDSGNGKSAEFVRAILIRVAWADTGGWNIITGAAHPHH